MGELFTGFGLGKREKENRESLANFLELEEVKVIPVDASIADRYAILVKYSESRGRLFLRTISGLQRRPLKPEPDL